jgi:protein ImuB
MAAHGVWSGIVRKTSFANNALRRRYLALWFPFLPSDRVKLEQGCAGPDKAPLALVTKVRGALRLAALNVPAAELGLEPGITLSDARARVPELAVVDHDEAADGRLLARMADLCDRYTPMVALKPPGALVLDVTGCAHLFDGEAGLAGDAKRRLQPWVTGIRAGLASSPEAAFALARFGPAGAGEDILPRLPVEALEIDDDDAIALRRAGLRTIGDLAERPAAAMAARFGEAAVSALARLMGQADSRIIPLRKPPELFFACRFAEPIVQIEHALKSIAALTRQAAIELRQRHAGGRHFAVRLYRSDGAVRDLQVETGRPTRDPDMIMRLFRERVEHAADPLDPGFGFDMIRLAVPAADPLAPAQLALMDGEITDEALTALVDRLSVRLGRDRIRRLAPIDTHIPEQQVLALPAIDLPAPEPWPAVESGEPPLRPIYLFDPPQPIDVTAQIPDGPPHLFRWRRRSHEVRRYEGPERISSEWWMRKSGPGLTRDYYRIEDMRGRRYWVFRHGLYGSERTHPGWYLHGLFV